MILRLKGAALAACALALHPFAARAQSEEPDHLLLLGAGVYATSNPYESAREKTETGVLPLFFYQNRYLTADLSGLAVKAYESKHFKLEGRISPRFQLVDPKDTRDFAFLERDTGVDVGARFSGMAGPATLSLELLADATGETEGQEINLDLTLAAQPTERLSLEAVAGLSWKDEKLATWLYGLRESEVAPALAYEFGRTARAPSGGVVVPSLGVQARYRLTERLYVIAAAEIEVFDDDIKDSPLMAKGQTAAGFVSLVRRF
ncbi:hypothetical protein DMC25_14690 [Caulobacter sp. D4A]|uniref:MipA/OmpV family protein n=1 Tax=unclassified Caulobacter TaxID=2648921 RepID=UPI000D732BC4|nr:MULTISPECIES: MipA/OmpV family protein [unclassified Caulobacter]PXA85860.1 hypothetical protein DMC25_14690 [Caulobacter sp. D4A]PXA87888.1 hypothetical protein DMC18_20055 [Caulobacter sp. D5]